MIFSLLIFRAILFIIFNMANFFTYQDKKFHIGDFLRVVYRIKEGEKERQQNFDGFLIDIHGSRPENKMITLRKVTKSGIGVERIFPLLSPRIVDINLKKESTYKKATAYFIRNLSETEIKRKLFKEKKHQSAKKNTK